MVAAETHIIGSLNMPFVSPSDLLSESDVEQKFILPLLIRAMPDGLGYTHGDFRSKQDIRKLAIDKGTGKKLYFPDYAIICDGLPSVIIEAKAPGQDLNEAMREARLYAAELNSLYPRSINPCEKIIATDGLLLLTGFWDQSAPVLSLRLEDVESTNPIFSDFLDFVSKASIKTRSAEILSSIRTTARYFKPVFMLGGKAVANETVGDNSFGTNVSLEYKYLFNPENIEDRAAVVKNAYVGSKRKQAHVAPIDKLIRSALPRKIVDANLIEDSEEPSSVIDAVSLYGRGQSEICLLIGSVGSGKSTFTDYLHLEALPASVTSATEWININLNKAPLSRDLIYQWILNQAISGISRLHSKIDMGEISILKKIYSRELASTEKGKAALYPKDSEKHIDIIFSEIDRLQKDLVATLNGIINFIYKGTSRLLVIVLDNCDKRNRDDQLLMFEVASWLKSSFACMVFLPLRDTTYDQYRNEPPLDTVIKDLVFRIDPPLLDRVIYARLNFALRQIEGQKAKFTYILPNGMKVECARAEVAGYLKTIIASLFQDQLFKRIISGLAGRNIRRGLEILLDFCKSGHIGENEILKIRTTNGDHHLPNHLIAKILLKGKRKYYSDSDSNIKNLFSSDDEDSLPDPFVRIAILQWLKNRWREIGPNQIIGFHQTESLIRDLQTAGHAEIRVLKELRFLITSGCIFSESQNNDINMNDLISIAPSGQIHLDLLRNINYLSAMSEDILFRENQPAKLIAENIVGRGPYRTDSWQSAIANSTVLINYLMSYEKSYFVGEAKVLSMDKSERLVNLDDLKELVINARDNDGTMREVHRLEMEYPIESEMEGQITSVVAYGFFVEFGLDGIGLVHRTNFNGVGYQITDNLEAGDWVVVKILGYNVVHRKFDLQMVGLSGGNPHQTEAQLPFDFP